MANTTIALKKSGTPAAAPSVLANGELAINYADGILYYKNATGQIVSFSSGAASDSFGIADVDGTLILSSVENDVLSFLSGNNITLTACTVSKSITFDALIRIPILSQPPGSAQPGDLFWNQENGRLFIYYDDVDSGQWIEANPSGETINVQSLISSDAAGFTHANAAFDKANSANVLAFNTGIGANAWSNAIATAGNNYTVSVGASSNAWANSLSTIDRALANAAANSANAYTITVGAAANNFANSKFYTSSNGTLAFGVANLANARANNIAIDTEMKGFLNQVETYLRFDTTSNTFTLADSGSGWSYYLGGIRYSLTGNSTVVVASAASNGTYYVTIDNNGTGALTASNTAWNLSDPETIPVAYIKYNQNTTPKYFIAEERHTVLMDSRTHRYLHFTRGTQAQQFGLLSGYTVGGTSNSNNIFSISTTILNDEDIILNLGSKTVTTGNSNNYIVFYRYAANSWTWSKSDLPYLSGTTGGAFIQYDTTSGLTQAANNEYVNSYLIFTNLDQGAGFAIIPGRATYANLTSAQAEDATTFDMAGFGVLESVVAYQLTWKTDDTLTTTGNCQLADVPRRIGTAIASVAPVYTSGLHNDQGGLQGGSAVGEYYHLTLTEYNALQSGTMGISANTFANTKLANTNGVSFAGDLYFPTGNIGIGTTTAASPLTIVEGVVTPIPLVNDLIDAEGNANSTVQLHVRNANTGLLGSSDFIATADNGTDTTNFIDLGINGSGYADPNWTINRRNDGYLYVSDSNLAIGTANSTATNKYVNFFVGGITSADEVMRIQDSAGGANVGIGRTNPGYKLDVVGSINCSAILVNGSPPAGGSGSPGGSSGQVQFNNASSFGGATNVTIHGNDLTLVESSPTTPGANTVKLFARNIAGRILPAIKGPSGLDTSLQPLLGRNKVTWFNPILGSASLTQGASGIVITATGTATAGTWASTTLAKSTARVNFRATTATTAVTGFRGGVNQYWRGNAAGLGGFTFIARWSIGTAASDPTTTTLRSFVGLRSSTANPTDVSPATLTNAIGVGFESGSTTLQIYCAGASMSQIDTGISLNRTVESTIFEVAIFCAPNGSAITIQATDVATGSSFRTEVTASANLPGTTTALNPYGWTSAGGTNTVMGFNLHGIYVETDS